MLRAECRGCGATYAHVPPSCLACGAVMFLVTTEDPDPAAVERREDPDQRPYVWEDDC